MNNATTSSTNTYTLTSNATGVLPYCPSHGYNSCSCFSSQLSNTLYGGNFVCSVCGQYFNSGSHICGGSSSTSNFSCCSLCGQYYIGSHICQGTINPTPHAWTTTGTNWQISTYKDVKEITTDAELKYEWNGGSFNMILPPKFSDCFLKVGYTWSPLYPLIFSAFENDSKELSFHLVVGIVGKEFEGDKVVLKSVTTTKIEDNLTLLQLTQRVRDYFKEDAQTNPAV